MPAEGGWGAWAHLEDFGWGEVGAELGVVCKDPLALRVSRRWFLGFLQYRSNRSRGCGVLAEVRGRLGVDAEPYQTDTLL
jgi:hypothetical protein